MLYKVWSKLLNYGHGVLKFYNGNNIVELLQCVFVIVV